MKPSTYGNIARLCEMYLDQFKTYSQCPHTDYAAKVAVENLNGIAQSLEKALAPLTFIEVMEEPCLTIHALEEDQAEHTGEFAEFMHRLGKEVKV